jgi:hypothetical protein
MKPREIVMSEQEVVLVKKLLRRKRMKRLPRVNDLPKLEREARREMQRSNARFGVG